MTVTQEKPETRSRSASPEQPNKPNRIRGFGLAVGVAAVILLLVIVINGGDGSKTSPPDTGVETEQSSPQQADALERMKDRYEDYNFSDFRNLATPAVDHSKNGRFIDRKVNGLQPAGKLDMMLRAAAEDKVTLVGLSKTITTRAFTDRQLQRARLAGQSSHRRYRVWDVLRDALTGNAKISNVKLNGKYRNTGLSSNGAVTSRLASYRNEPGTSIRLAAYTANGRTHRPGRLLMKDICANRQLPAKQAPPPSVVTPPSRVKPPSGGPAPAPKPKPKQGPKHRPVTDEDLNKGGPLPKQQGDCFECDYRPVPNSPQAPPPGRVEVPPTGGTGPQPPGDDSAGNTSPPPTQPPTDTGKDIPPGDSGGF